jgi:hypothetical protein
LKPEKKGMNMDLKHNPLHCIVPPQMLRALLQHDEFRDVALRTIIASSRLREQRRLLSAMPPRVPAGEKRRTIYDANNGTLLPGKLVCGEGDRPSTDTAVNEAYDGLGATCDLYHDVYGRNSIDDQGMRLDASVADRDCRFFTHRRFLSNRFFPVVP